MASIKKTKSIKKVLIKPYPYPFVPKFQYMEGFAKIHFPEDSRNAQAWDQFWQHILNLNLNYLPLRYDPPTRSQRYLTTFVELECKRILFAGNGVCALPGIFSHHGLEVHSCDIASTAVDFCRNMPLDREAAYLFFEGPDDPFGLGIFERLDPRVVEQVIARGYRQGGSLSFEVADLFAVDFPTGYFDGIVVQSLTEHFPARDQLELTQRFYRWLRPGGVAIVESMHLKVQDSDGTEKGIEAEYEAAGFVYHLKSAYEWREEVRSSLVWPLKGSMIHRKVEMDEEFARRKTSGRISDLALLRQGQKLAIFYPSR